MELTPKQSEIVEFGDGNLAVSASAGSGKTEVLIQRLRHLICEKKVEAEKLLVTTFTEAAAAEMKARLAKEMDQYCTENPGNEFAMEQLGKISGAHVQTIHSFCMDILKEYFYTVNLPPALRVAETAEMQLLKNEIMDQLMRDGYEGKIGAAFQESVERFCRENDDEPLRKLIARVYATTRERVEGVRWVRAQAEKYRDDKMFERYCEIAAEPMKRKAKAYAETCFRELQNIDPVTDTALYEAMKFDVNTYESWAHAKNLYAMKSMVETMGTRPKATKPQNEHAKELRKTVWGEKSNTIREALKQLPDETTEKKIHATVAKEIENLAELVERFDAAVREESMKRGILPLENIQQEACQVLENTAIVEELRARFRYIFIDEYQDSNEIQEKILTTISRGDNLFVVGDVKQSIYRFREADPALFTERIKRAGTGDGFVKYLNMNYRSDEELLEAVNYYFEREMTAVNGGVDYDNQQKLIPRDDIVFPTEGIHGACLLVADGKDRAPEAVAAKIKDLIGKTIFVPKRRGKNGEKATEWGGDDFRAIKPGDIAILTFKNKDGLAFEKALKALDIYSTGVRHASVQEAGEVKTILSVLTVIENPYNDAALLGALRSYIGGFNEEELARIRIEDEKKVYRAALEKAGITKEDREFEEAFLTRGDDETVKKESHSFAEAFFGYDKDDAIGKKIRDFCGKIEKWRLDVKTMKTDEFLSLLCRETEYDSYVLGLPHGAERQNQLKKLVKIAKRYTKDNNRGLHSFLAYMEKIRMSKVEERESGEISADEDCVKIMTFHKSKGLQFPIVFCYFKNNKKNTQNRDVLIDSKLGIAPRYFDRAKWEESKTVAYLALDANDMVEEVSETIRLQYVAMTRPKNMLYVCCEAEKGMADLADEWSSGVKKAGMAENTMQACRFGTTIIRHPGMTELRNLAPEEQMPEDDKSDSKWQYEVFKATDETDPELGGDDSDDGIVPADVSQLDETGEPRRAASLTKISVSKLKKKETVISYTMEKSDVDAGELSAAEIGTATHMLLRRLDFSRKCDEQIEQLVSEGVISGTEAKVIDRDAVNRMIFSEIGRKIATRETRRELPFTYKVKAAAYQDGAAEDDEILIQGIIDCVCYNEDGTVDIIDYKTDSVKPGEEKRAAERHRTQLEIYADAMKTITGKTVAAKVVVFVKTGGAVVL